MARGFFNHFWYKLLDEDGVPAPSAYVYIYDLNSPTTQLTIFDENFDVESQPLITNSNGVFDFYVKDNIGTDIVGAPSGSYEWNKQFIISWNDGVDKSGVISGDRLFGNFETVNTSGSTTSKNKTMSNYIGWLLEKHVNSNMT